MRRRDYRPGHGPARGIIAALLITTAAAAAVGLIITAIRTIGGAP